MLWGHHHPHTKNRHRYYQKKIIIGQYHDEHRCKNPQQNTSKLSPAIHYKKGIIYHDQVGSEGGRILQYPQINQYDTPQIKE